MRRYKHTRALQRKGIEMNKQELITKIAEKSELSKKDADKALAALTSTITEALKTEDKVSLVGFGTFEVKTRAAKESRNPRTGEKMMLTEKKLPVFKAGAGLKDAVNH